MIKELIKLATDLDRKGHRKEADYLDAVISKVAQQSTSPQPPPQREVLDRSVRQLSESQIIEEASGLEWHHENVEYFAELLAVNRYRSAVEGRSGSINGILISAGVPSADVQKLADDLKKSQTQLGYS